jgi:predicted transglutaminase-like protease
MSVGDLTEAANRETNKNMVPDGWPGLIIYSIRHLGPSVVLSVAMTAVTLYGLNKIYTDMQLTNAAVLMAFNDRTKIETEHVATMKAMQSTLLSIDQRLSRVKIEP